MLAAADSTLVRLERNGVVYRISREDEDASTHYNPDAISQALHRFAGMITPEEGERLKAAIYSAREEGTRPVDRP